MVLHEWVSRNNVDADHPFRKGWWDWVQSCEHMARLLMLDVHAVSVVGEITITTPPPENPLTLPVVRLETRDFTVILAQDFSRAGFAPAYLAHFTDWTVTPAGLDLVSHFYQCHHGVHTRNHRVDADRNTETLIEHIQSRCQPTGFAEKWPPEIETVPDHAIMSFYTFEDLYTALTLMKTMKSYHGDRP